MIVGLAKSSLTNPNASRDKRYANRITGRVLFFSFFFSCPRPRSISHQEKYLSASIRLFHIFTLPGFLFPALAIPGLIYFR